MKLTTKITIVIILTVFALALLFIIGFSFTDMKNQTRRGRNSNSNNVVIPVDIEIVEKKCGQFKKVVFAADSIADIPVMFIDLIGYETDENGEKKVSDYINYIKLVDDDTGDGALTMSAFISDFIYSENIDDTLYVRLNTPELLKKLGNPKMEKALISGFQLTLKVQNLHIVNKMSGVHMEADFIATDTMNFESRGGVTLNGCYADVFAFSNVSALFMRHCNIRELNIDLDNTYHWNVYKCSIGVENLTGSGNHTVQQRKTESQIVNWLPKSREARLQVQLYGDTTKIKF